MSELKTIEKPKTPSAAPKSGKTPMKILLALHLFAYIAVSGLLTLIWALTLDLVSDLTGFSFFWPIIPILGFHASHGHWKFERFGNPKRVNWGLFKTPEFNAGFLFFSLRAACCF